MSKREFYEQCKAALHEMNLRGYIGLSDYPADVNAFLRSLGARPMSDGFARSPATRQAEALGEVDRLIEEEAARADETKDRKKALRLTTKEYVVAIVALLATIVLGVLGLALR